MIFLSSGYDSLESRLLLVWFPLSPLQAVHQKEKLSTTQRERLLKLLSEINRFHEASGKALCPGPFVRVR